MKGCFVLPVLWLAANVVVNGGRLSPQKVVPVDLEIKKLQKDDANFVLEFTKGLTEISTVVGYNLLVSVNGDEQYNVYSSVFTNNGNDYAVTFTGSLDGLGGNIVDFVLNALADSPPMSVVTGGTMNFDTFPVFPISVVMNLASYEDATVSEIETKADKFILRASATTIGDLDEIFPMISDGISVSNVNTFYHLQFSAAGNEYSLCNSDNDVLVCDNAKPVTAVSITKDLAMVESATLRYSNTLGVREIEVIKASGGISTGLDAIITDSLALCTSGSTAICDQTTFTLGNDVSMFIIGLDGDDMKAYADFTITDYHVTGQGLTSTTLEVRWDFQESLPQYKITRTPIEGGTFSDAIVNCDPGVPGTTVPCFGYFTGLAPGTPYRITVQPNTGDDSVDNLNIIESAPITLEAKYSGMQIRLHQLSRRQNGGILEAKVCFNHISHNKEIEYSHYEFMLINNQGQWQKQKLMTHYVGGDICFKPFSLHTQTFDVTEGATLIVTQRATDQFTVLASGETQVTFS